MTDGVETESAGRGLLPGAKSFDPRVAELVDAMLAGDQRALARLITIIENRSSLVPAILGRAYASTGSAHIVGVTGPPGAGKSTLVDRLISGCRSEGGLVGVLAVDPSSPYTGGAILGDRIRMQQWAADPDVFIRSLAARGHLGGLSLATRDAARLLDAAGYGTIIIETVGTGQSEVDIMDLAHTVIVILAPGGGDEVQAQKAGILEIADILVVNKADRDGAIQLVAHLEAMLDLAGELPWRPPVIQTVASTGQGIPELLTACRSHQQWLAATGRSVQRRADQVGRELQQLAGRIAAEQAVSRARASGSWDGLVSDVAARRLDPYAAAALLLAVMTGSELASPAPEGNAKPAEHKL